MAVFHTWITGAYGSIPVDEVSVQVAELVVGALGLLP